MEEELPQVTKRVPAELPHRPSLSHLHSVTDSALPVLGSVPCLGPQTAKRGACWPEGAFTPLCAGIDAGTEEQGSGNGQDSPQGLPGPHWVLLMYFRAFQPDGEPGGTGSEFSPHLELRSAPREEDKGG